LHPNLLQFTAKSGRFSSIEPNLQNLHKEEWDASNPEFLIRRAFAAPEDDELLFFFDYSQQEMIFMLDQAGVLAVIEKLKSGEFKDFYLATGAVIKERAGMELSRFNCKQVSLGLAYGQGGDLLAYNLKMPKDKAFEVKGAYFKGVPELKTLDYELKNIAKYTGKLHLPTGRVSYIPAGKDHACLNYYVQGSCADIIKASLVKIHEKLKAGNFKSRLALTVHDEIIMRIKEKEIEKVVPLVKDIMQNIYKPKHIGLSVDVDYSPRNAQGLSVWGEKVKYAGL
jgi:DNA polymerase I